MNYIMGGLIGNALYNMHMEKEIRETVKWIKQRIKEDHDFELEIKNTLKIKHNVKLSKHHIEVYAKGLIKLKYNQK